MTVALNDEELKLLRMKLKQGEYDGVDIMHAWLSIDELRELRVWRDKAFLAHSNIDLDIEALGDAPKNELSGARRASDLNDGFAPSL